ncbi:hypothetical protein CB3_019 [Pectobacterium phage vB_PatP_CB3]|uniref:Uncharacterized protein n=2 Tax=Cbunavirus CB4 TaxID=2845777 RepID=A0A2P9J4W9_9CAUD|nr:hypothetical protein HWB09_gp019 [Pectobacterium phage vB_PatP_CB4]AQT27861.1 hypothetical protein CB4_019 [Pectobacterium phage vB_PatP_CB4]ARB11843.1 hypothetical protein CB3_019 [Pectobacterium phage vB_PatP_CB3]
MAEHTYKSKDLTAVITWDMAQLAAWQNEGRVLADIDIHAYIPSQMRINESYMFRHSGIHFSFIIPMDDRPEIAMRALLRIPQTITKELHYVLPDDPRA